MRKTRMTASAVLFALFAGPVFAADGSTESPPSATHKVSFNADLRLRWEAIAEEGSNDRERGRFRARLGVKADVAENVQLIARLATGSGNPASTNQNFGDGFSAKDIAIDRAYIDWTINDKLHLFGGKMKNPYFRAGGNALVWDSDLNPEGVAAAFRSDRGFANLGLMVVTESAEDDDVLLYAAQAGFTFAMGDAASLTTGVGYFDYRNVAGAEPFFKARAKGNSVDAEGNYLFDFSIVEVFAEYKNQWGDWPLTVFGEWNTNAEVDNEDTAYAFGVKLGSSGRAGNMAFSYAYHDTEADALIGTFTDSDFAGGNTDSNGHFLKASYGLRDHIVLGSTLIISKIGEFAGNERDYDRIMFDIVFKF